MLIEYGNTATLYNWHLDERQATGYSRIYYAYSGEVEYESGGQKTRFRPGYLYILPSTQPYTARRATREDFVCTYMHISFFEAHVTRLITVRPEEGSCLFYYLKTVRHCISEGKTELLELLADAFDQFLKGDPAYVRASEMQNTVQQYIREHISEEVKIEDLSRLFSYHPNYFIRIFRQETGYTPHQFLLQQRMQYAVALLTRGLGNQEICDACGYTDSSTFTRAFRKYYGVAPQKYRKGFRKP